MEEVGTKIQEALAEAQKPKSQVLKKTLIALGIVVFVVLAVGGSAYGYTLVYKDKVYPGVMIGQADLSGMTRDEVVKYLENLNNRLVREGISLSVTKKDGTQEIVRLESMLSNGEDSVEVVRFDSNNLADWAISNGRTSNWLGDLVGPFILRFAYPNQRAAEIVVDENRFKESLLNNLAKYEDANQNANVQVVNLKTGEYKVTEEKTGLRFNYPKIEEQIKNNLHKLSFSVVAIELEEFVPTVTRIDVENILPVLPEIFADGEIGLHYINPQNKLRKDWVLKPENYASWLEVIKDENDDPIFALNQEKVKSFLEEQRVYVDQPAESARFVIEDNKVKEFKGSQTGISLDINKTYDELNTAFKARNYRRKHGPEKVIKTVAMATHMVDPEVKLSDVNNLGITDVIGVGVSTFRDSHTNRIKNITNAVRRLNGVLIKPDEEFSANRYAGPYTAENGFLPEAVIKGNEIKNEIGGGMCQIGTTLFRMAMNSGLDITQRRNHSLVVGYYADPVNGNPGTDATLYEPMLDLKFKNDTGNYLLLQTDIDFKKQQLTFTLWGKPDGRSGSYTHPLVSKWIPAGTPQVIKTTKLAPGKKDCQAAFRGAVASFTYTRITPSGEKIERVFDSYYRPLPQICLVGVDPNEITDTPPTAPCPEGQVCEPVEPVTDPIEPFSTST